MKKFGKKFGSLILTFIFVLTLCIPPTVAMAEETNNDNYIYVDKNVIDTDEDGTEDNPYLTITKGIEEASDGDTVYIKEGTYNEYLTISNSIEITLKGEGQDKTIIDGNNDGRVFKIESGCNAQIENLTIQRGKSQNGKHGINQENDYGQNGEKSEDGGGIYNEGELRLTDCKITNNSTGNGGNGSYGYSYGGSGGFSGNGGGIYNKGDLWITDCKIENNHTGNGGNGKSGESRGGNGGSTGSGGGIYNEGNITVTDCEIENNNTGNGGNGGYSDDGNGGNGGSTGSGGGIFNKGTVIVTGSRIVENRTGNGGIFGEGAAPSRNGNGGSSGRGGGIYSEETLTVTGSLIEKNNTGNGSNGKNGGHSGSGGGVYSNGNLTITGSKITNNNLGNAGKSEEYSEGVDGNNGSGIQIYQYQSNENSIDIGNNWWGSNAGPNSEDIKSNLDFNVAKWLVLDVAMADSELGFGGSTTVTADLSENNNGESVSDSVYNIQISFEARKGTINSSAVTTDGIAIVEYTGTVAGKDTITVTLDDETIKKDIIIKEIDIKGDTPIGILDRTYEATFLGEGGKEPYIWSAMGLPSELAMDLNTGKITGIPKQEGDYNIEVTLTDDNGVSINKQYTLTIKNGSGNGAYLITPNTDSAYKASTTDDGIPLMTVNTGVSGFTYFSVKIEPRKGHSDDEVCVFVHLRDGKQLGMSFVKADLEKVDNAGAGFNVQEGDIIKAYIVDNLTNGTATNPNVL